MTIGLIILGILAVMLFFGAAEKYFDRLGLTSWLTFLLILALIVGAVVPEIKTEGFIMTVGGFIIPLIVGVIILIFAVKDGEALRTSLAIPVVAALTVMFRLVIGVNSTATVLATSLLIGFVGGAAAYLAAGSRLGTLAGALGGCIIGDAISAALLRGLFGYQTLTLGGYGIFDGMIIAATFGLIMAETVAAVRRAVGGRLAKEQDLNAEAGEDVSPGADSEYSSDVMFNTSEAEAQDIMDNMADSADLEDKDDDKS